MRAGVACAWRGAGVHHLARAIAHGDGRAFLRLAVNDDGLGRAVEDARTASESARDNAGSEQALHDFSPSGSFDPISRFSIAEKPLNK